MKIIKYIINTVIVPLIIVIGVFIYLDKTESNLSGYENLRLYGSGKIISNYPVVINTQDAWHLVTGIESNVFAGLEFGAGASSTISGFYDAGGGKVGVTSTNSLLENSFVSITGTTNYNGLFEVTNITANNFEITDTWVADDGTGTWRKGTTAKIQSGQGGTYVYIWSISATAATANTTFEFTIVNDVTSNGITRRKFSTNTDVGSMSGVSIVETTAGDRLSVGIRNITSDTDLTINAASFVVFKIY